MGPVDYGDMSFLLGSFTAILSLLNMGSSSAFFTHISQRSRGLRIYIVYFSWLAIQFFVTFIFVALVIPSALFERVWIGHSRGIVALAFIAIFMQQSIWPMISQIGESVRKTTLIQALNIGIATAYLLMILLFSVTNIISLSVVFQILIFQYVIAAVLAYKLLNFSAFVYSEADDSYYKIILEFWSFCKPLIVLGIIGSFYAFISNWMLQRYGGSAEQGYFQIASQFASVCLLATSSILNIFWKEIAEATAKGDQLKVADLYKRVNRGLVMVNVTIAGFLLPWSKEIVVFLLGAMYVDAWPVLAIMFLYPIHQSMGQIGATMLVAQGKTKIYALLGSATNIFISLPILYFTLAPASGVDIPGLGLGAIGIATSTVLVNFLSVNFQAFIISHISGWKFDFKYQYVGIPLIIGLGYLAKTLTTFWWDSNDINGVYFFVLIIFSFLIYSIFLVFSLWSLPWLIGAEKHELKKLIDLGFKSAFMRFK